MMQTNRWPVLGKPNNPNPEKSSTGGDRLAPGFIIRKKYKRLHYRQPYFPIQFLK